MFESEVEYNIFHNLDKCIYLNKKLGETLENTPTNWLKQIKYHLIGTINEGNKREVNRQLRQIDKQIRKLKQC